MHFSLQSVLKINKCIPLPFPTPLTDGWPESDSDREPNDRDFSKAGVCGMLFEMLPLGATLVWLKAGDLVCACILVPTSVEEVVTGMLDLDAGEALSCECTPCGEDVVLAFEEPGA